MIQSQVSRTRGGCPGTFSSVLCTETPHFCHHTAHAHQIALELVLSMENMSLWAHPLLLVSDWHKSCCKAGRKWVCSARTCSVTDHEHSHCSGVSPARANKMLLPRAFDSCKNRSSRNTGCQKHTRASKQLVDVRSRVRKYPENQGQLFSGTNNPATPELQLLDWSQCECDQWPQYRAGLLGLNSARHRALTYTAESAGLPEEDKKFWRVWN